MAAAVAAVAIWPADLSTNAQCDPIGERLPDHSSPQHDNLVLGLLLSTFPLPTNPSSSTNPITVGWRTEAPPSYEKACRTWPPARPKAIRLKLSADCEPIHVCELGGPRGWTGMLSRHLLPDQQLHPLVQRIDPLGRRCIAPPTSGEPTPPLPPQRLRLSL